MRVTAQQTCHLHLEIYSKAKRNPLKRLMVSSVCVCLYVVLLCVEQEEEEEEV